MNRTLDGRYKGGWSQVNHDCDLCHMEQKTEWHIETPRFVVADTLHGNPFIVLKKHKDSLTEDEREAAEHLVDLLFDNWELHTIMDQYPNHWHSHITQNE